MTRIALTGTAGNIGRELLNAFDDSHDLCPFTHSEHEDIDGDTLDVTDPEDVVEKLDNFDVVIHLAGASSPDADWKTVSETNIQGTKHSSTRPPRMTPTGSCSPPRTTPWAPTTPKTTIPRV